MDTQEKENTQKENTQNKQIQKKETDNPHDKGYKRIFSIKKHFLHFIKKYIALEWMMELEEKDLELIDKEFITDQFQILFFELHHPFKRDVDRKSVV